MTSEPTRAEYEEIGKRVLQLARQGHRRRRNRIILAASAVVVSGGALAALGGVWNAHPGPPPNTELQCFSDSVTRAMTISLPESAPEDETDLLEFAVDECADAWAEGRVSADRDSTMRMSAKAPTLVACRLDKDSIGVFPDQQDDMEALCPRARDSAVHH